MSRPRSVPQRSPSAPRGVRLFTRAEVRALRRRITASGPGNSMHAIARELGVNYRTIRNLAHGVTYSDVD